MVDKRLKYVLYILMIISLFLTIKSKVSAASLTLSNPTRVNADRTNGTTDNIGYQISTWWDNQFIEGKRNIGPWANGIIYKQQSYQWDNYGLCSGKSMLIEGEIGGLFDFFNQNYSVDVYNSGAKMTCYFARYDASRLKYSCSGVGGGQFLINVSYGTPQNAYTIGVSKVVNITCDASSSDIQNSINNLSSSINNQTTNIINNQNNNTQSIINNQNQNSQNTQQKIENIDNTIKDSNVDTNNANNTFNNLNSNMASNSTISDLLLMPIHLLQKVLNGLEGSCSAINTGQLLGEDFILPCINISDIIGSTLWNIVDVICSGFLAYYIGRRFVVIFNQFTNLKEGGLESAYD